MNIIKKLKIDTCIFDFNRFKVKVPIYVNILYDVFNLRNIKFILDTGAEITCISYKNLINDLNYTLDELVNIYNNHKIHETVLTGFDGSKIEAFSFKIPKMNIGGFELNNFEIYTINPNCYSDIIKSNNSFDITTLLGMDILRYFKIELEFPYSVNSNDGSLSLSIKDKYIEDFNKIYHNYINNPDEYNKYQTINYVGDNKIY